jgi:hypothetical protein
MSPSLLLTAALTATRAAQGAARFNVAKSLTAKDIERPTCPAASVSAAAFERELNATEGEQCSRVCVPPSFSSLCAFRRHPAEGELAP